MIVEIFETGNQARIAKAGKTFGNAVEQPQVAFGETCEQQTGMRSNGAAGKISLDVLRPGTIRGWTGEPSKSTVCGHGERCYSDY